jgi:hypothetical protein
VYSELEDYLDSGKAQGMSHSDLERELEKRGRELLRQLFQSHLDGRGTGEAEGEVKGSDGVTRAQARLQTRRLETVFGTVTVDRVGYGATGVDSLHPQDAALNLPDERYSLEVRRRVAVEASRGSFEETVAAVERSTGARVAKRQAEQLAVRAAQDFEAFYASRREAALEQPEVADILVVSFDGKGVVMRREDLREPTRKAAKKRKHKLKTRLCKGEKRNAKRMATVAAVYTVAPHPRSAEDVVRGLAGIDGGNKDKPPRPRPQHKRVMASLEKRPAEVIEEIFADAAHRDPERTKTWVAVVDGDKHQLRLIHQEARRRGVELTTVLDIIHVTEYLWKAGAVLNPEGSEELETWVHERLLAILDGRSSYVAAGMRRSATRRGLPSARRKPVDVCANYLLTYRRYLRYDQYLARGLPIATGVIEGACRHLVKDRMDLTGARWSLAGAEAVLRLRALRASGDFDEYWRFHEKQEYERNHASRYADGAVPPVGKQGRTPHTRRHLKVVK